MFSLRIGMISYERASEREREREGKKDGRERVVYDQRRHPTPPETHNTLSLPLLESTTAESTFNLCIVPNPSHTPPRSSSWGARSFPFRGDDGVCTGTSARHGSSGRSAILGRMEGGGEGVDGDMTGAGII